MCQIIHGAPFGLIAIYPKHQLELPDNREQLFDTFEPKKNLIIHRCKECGVPLFSWTGNYDVWGVYVSSAIEYNGKEVKTRDIPAFEGVCHIFYEERQRDVKYAHLTDIANVRDGLEKWMNLPGASELITNH